MKKSHRNIRSVNPRVSILLPCLNARRFLEARISSLLSQTISDWEAIVLDAHSTDGSWEYFQAVGADDERFRLYQLPRDGLYAALNRGIELARGEFLHIATCDDTMEADFLSVTLEALIHCPSAGIAATDVRFIDAQGNESIAARRLGSNTVRTARPEQTLRDINYRPAPHDCLLHLTGGTVYFSLTQLVVRTALARRAPQFDVQAGSIADFTWSFGLTNLAGTVHIPRQLATWRLHGNQLSLQPDDSRLAYLAETCHNMLPRIQRQHADLLSANHCSALLLPSRITLAKDSGKYGYVALLYLESIGRLLWLAAQRPLKLWRAARAVNLSYGNLKLAWVATILQSLDLYPHRLDERSAGEQERYIELDQRV